MNDTDHNIKRVEQAVDAMRRAMAGARERLGEGSQLTRTQLEILMLLQQAPQATGELAVRLFLTQSAVTQTIDTLVRRELVERHPDDTDRRIIRLHLTPAGLELTARMRELKRAHMQALMNKLTPAEIEAMITITEKLTLVFEESKATTKQP